MQSSASGRVGLPRSQRYLGFVPLGWGFALVSCGKTIADPCFEATYDVQLIERVEESSTCPAPWASAWTFRVVPQKISLRGAYGECSQVALHLDSDVPRNFTGFGLSYLTATGVGAIDGRYASEDPEACPAWSSLEAHVPHETWNVADAAADDEVLWKMDIIDIDGTCGIPVPEGGRCTDVYTSRMTKVADWDWQENP